MRIAQINDVPARSTGTIMKQISRYVLAHGEDCYDFTPCVAKDATQMPGHFYIGGLSTRLRHQFLAEHTGLNGFFSAFATWKMLRQFDELGIELIHLHNIHNYCVNLPMLFHYIRKRNIPVVWTLHGAWAYTGKCVHHVLASCNKWKMGCGKCPQLDVWPYSKVDHTKFMWKWKKRQTERIKNLTVVATSEWLSSFVKESFLAPHRLQCIYSGINLHVFKPTPSDFRQKHNCLNKVILLGIADRWRPGKGLSTMIELADRMDNRYQVVIVGIQEGDSRIPENIVAINYTANRQELAQIYTAADIFIQPTRAETFGLVGAEALACGTPVITYRTGGSPEIVDETCGCIVECGDIEGLIRAIKEEVMNRRFKRENCLKRAEKFGVEKMSQDYLDLYADILSAAKK